MKLRYVLLGILITTPVLSAGFFKSLNAPAPPSKYQLQQIQQTKEYNAHQNQLQQDVLRDRVWRETKQPVPDKARIYELNKQIDQLKEYK